MYLVGAGHGVTQRVSHGEICHEFGESLGQIVDYLKCHPFSPLWRRTRFSLQYTFPCFKTSGAASKPSGGVSRAEAAKG